MQEREDGEGTMKERHRREVDCQRFDPSPGMLASLFLTAFRLRSVDSPLGVWETGAMNQVSSEVFWMREFCREEKESALTLNAEPSVVCGALSGYKHFSSFLSSSR